MKPSPGTAGDAGNRPEAPDAGVRLLARQVEVLYDQLPVALAASVAAALVLVGLFWAATPGPVLISWFALLLLVTALRKALVHRYRHSGDKQERAGYWLAWFIAGTLASGALWDATIILLAPRGSNFHVGIAALWVCGLTAGSVAALSSVKGAFLSFSIPALVPGAAYLLLSGNKTEATIGGGVFMFFGFLSLNALWTHRTVRQSLELQFENNELVAHLDAEKESIEKLNEQLEMRVAERTADISAADAAKSRFLAAASHDLRQPLQTFSLLTAILSRTVRDPEPAKTVHELRNTINVMSSLLDALLDISKLDSGAITPEVKDFSIGELLERLRIVFENHARDKDLGLHVVHSSAVIRSDPVLLENIVRNLLSNAIRYTKNGKVLLGCRRRGLNLRIEVWDTGIGIPPEQLNRIFEEFYQLGNPARDHSKGWGLGLAIIERSARLMGHRVEVHSTPGKGSVFAVEVPLGTLSSQPVQAHYGEPVTGNNHQQASIFLVEDEKVVREATCCLLELCNFRVATAMNSEEASRNIQALEVRPDLIIADYRLPMKQTGIDVVRHIRELLHDEIPGIILTGDISPKITREAGANHLHMLHKPVDPDELLALINELLTQTDSDDHRHCETRIKQTGDAGSSGP